MAESPVKGKVAIVTGARGGIGASIVSWFLAHGAKVAALDISPSTESASESLIDIKTNITSESEIDMAISTVMEKWGHIDILINCAGVMDDFSFVGNVKNDIWERCFAVNVTGPMYLIRRLVPQFKLQESKGCIVNFCSVASVRGGAAGAAYTASKHALLGLSRSTAWAYAKDGIRCNAVMPGSVPTGIMGGIAMNMGDLEGLKSFHACAPGQLQPTDVAEAVGWLASAKNINGAEVAADLGWLAV